MITSLQESSRSQVGTRLVYLCLMSCTGAVFRYALLSVYIEALIALAIAWVLGSSHGSLFGQKINYFQHQNINLLTKIVHLGFCLPVIWQLHLDHYRYGSIYFIRLLYGLQFQLILFIFPPSAYYFLLLCVNPTPAPAHPVIIICSIFSFQRNSSPQVSIDLVISLFFGGGA